MSPLRLRLSHLPAWLRAGLASVALCACSLDSKPAAVLAADTPEPVRLRERDRSTTGAASGSDSDGGSDARCRADSCANGGRCEVDPAGTRCRCSAGFTGSRCEDRSGSCSSNPCAHDGRCDDTDAGFHCTCTDGFSGATCEAQCGNGSVELDEVCDEGADNGKPGHCDTSCEQPPERILIRSPEADERVVNPVFFDWELEHARPQTTYCTMLMTDRAGTPEDRIGEQVFYAGRETELVLTLNNQRYRSAFSFAVISVACADLDAQCRSFDCVPGQECALPCAGRIIASESRALLGVRPR